jgi:hypothetical protein
MNRQIIAESSGKIPEKTDENLCLWRCAVIRKTQAEQVKIQLMANWPGGRILA